MFKDIKIKNILWNWSWNRSTPVKITAFISTMNVQWISAWCAYTRCLICLIRNSLRTDSPEREDRLHLHLRSNGVERRLIAINLTQSKPAGSRTCARKGKIGWFMTWVFLLTRNPAHSSRACNEKYSSLHNQREQARYFLIPITPR